jgi:hypothetical protein
MVEHIRKDLQPNLLTELSWEPDKVQVSLNTLFAHVTKEATDAIDWYLKSKRRKRRWAVLLRILAIVAASVAGILPMLAQIFINESGRSIIQPAWASVSLGIAAALVALDRFFGFSSGWIRYIAAELQIRELLQEFQIDWEIQKASLRDGVPDENHVQAMLARAKEFTMQVSTIVKDETSDWIREFQSALKQIDDVARRKASVIELERIARSGQ